MEPFMKRIFLLIALTFSFVAAAVAQDKGDEVLRRSEFYEPPNFAPIPSSFPQRFNEIGQSHTQPQASTGYYFVDSEDNAPDYWRPTPVIVDTNTEPTLWRRIVQGPRVIDPQYWTNNPQEGLRFFRNPARADGGGLINYFEHGSANACDSTDNAFAGPIPIGFAFYFNGLRYDSFYVTTNGLVALTNRRYFYNANGNRTIPTGGTDCYDPQSMDWFQRGRSGDGILDGTFDDFGYRYSVLGNNPTNYTAGIRKPAGALNTFTASQRAALIAPFYGDNHLSQYYQDIDQPDDWGKCYFKRSNSADKLIIYFVNLAPKGLKGTPNGAYNAASNLRWGEQNYVAASAQVALSRRDSSVTITYERFDGVAIVNRRAVPSSVVFRYNTTVGVRGFARHVNYGETGGPNYPWASEYEQFTHYFSHYATTNVNYPYNYLAVKFKQWQNSLRVVDIQYRVRKADQNAGLEFTEIVPSTAVDNYELLAGEDQIGAIQPLAIIQNLTNEIQGPSGVNFVPQDFNFRARFRIINEANQRIIYNRLVPIDSLCLALGEDNFQECTGDPDVRVRYVDVEVDKGNYETVEKPFPGTNGRNGIPPYEFVQIYFPPFVPNENVTNHIGRLRAFIIADPTNPVTGEGVGDEWPFDDTASVRLFVMNRLSDFSDDAREYHIINNVAMPSVLKWVNIDAEVVPGEDVSLHPLPPRGEYESQNIEGSVMESPVIRMSRKQLNGAEPLKSPGGDELRSFPIDLRGKYNSVISLSVQRTAHNDDWERGWSDQTLIGAEPRSILNGDPYTVWTQNGYAASRYPDELLVELARPSPDGLKFITNIPDKRWRHHPRRNGADPETEMAALTIYGAGGYMVGFLETDKDSALAPYEPGVINGLRPNVYDDGIDYEYKRYFIPIPDTIINSDAEGAKNFRFRLKMNATNDKKCIICIPDDDDLYFVDNVTLLFYSPEATDLAITACKVDWPYTQAPASQATDIPLSVTVSNNTSNAAPTFVVKGLIYRGHDFNPGTQYDPIYCRFRPISSLPGKAESIIQMPNWNAREWGPGQYRFLGIVTVPGGDLQELNDTTYFDFEIKFGDSFAYDPVEGDPVNNVPEPAFTGIYGRGLNIFGYAYGGNGRATGPTSVYPEEQAGAGDRGGAGSGQVAVRFQLQQTDTIYGFQTYWGSLNYAPDPIRFSIYSDAGGRSPNQLIQSTVLYKERGIDDIRNDVFFNEYVTNLYNDPVVLSSGYWWAIVAQLGETGNELGASKSRVGMRTTNVYIPPPVNIGGPTGAGGVSLMIEKTFRELIGFDTYNQPVIVNRNFFALENSLGSGTWLEFMPAIGNPAYAHLHHFGVSPADGATSTLSRGTWIPMFRPYLGERSYSTDTELPDCSKVIPVEFTYFTGDAVSEGINLEWETKSEYNNLGFYVERRINDDNTDWESINFVDGVGNSSVSTKYNFTDNDVVLNTTYQYRLRQVDVDGTHDCSISDIVNVHYGNLDVLVLEQNAPNPFSESTVIRYEIPNDSEARLDIIDMYGNVVKSFSAFGAGQIVWDGTDYTGNLVSTGTYIYRMTADNEVATGKMTLVR